MNVYETTAKHIGQTVASDEATQTSASPKQEQELKQAIKEANQVLISATNVFPLAIFPDTLTVDRTKLTITRRSFFRVAEVMSIRIEDILHITANVGPIFGSVKMTSRIINDEQHYNIDKFWRDDAMRIKRIVQGYIVALKNNIDCCNFSTQELAEMLDRLGKDDHQGV